MGNQIKFSEKKREDPFSGNEDSRALEIKNIELKNTNRNLIAKIDQQKRIIKDLKLELKSAQINQHPTTENSPNKPRQKTRKEKDYSELKQENERLKVMLDESKKEITELNSRINDLTSMGPWNILKK